MSIIIINPYIFGIGETNCGNFDANLWGDLGYHSEFNVSHCELEIIFYESNLTDYETYISIGGDANPTYRQDGILLRRDSGTSSLYFYGFGVTRLITNALTQDTVHKIVLKIYNGNGEIWINDVSVDTFTVSVGMTGVRNTIVGGVEDSANSNDVNWPGDFEKKSIKFWGLNSSGVRITSLIDIDFDEGTGLTAGNNAVDKPTGSDLIFDLNGSGSGDQWTVWTH